jgi:GNAT superfamily N-acetyltransferase
MLNDTTHDTPRSAPPTRYEAAQLRWAGLSDIPALTDLYRTAHENPQETPESLLEWLSRGGALILQDAEGRLLCALRWREADEGWEIDRIATLPQARGQNYGRWLMTKLEALAIRNNIATLTLTLASPETDLLAYYKRMGYQTVEQGDGEIQLQKRVGGMWQYKR